METMKRMAAVVDEAECGRSALSADGAEFRRVGAFQAACDLVFKGASQPNGYTEPILHARRAALKRAEA